MTGLERETTINFNDEEDFAEISTFQMRWLTRLRKHKEAKFIKDIEMGSRVIGKIYHIPKTCITLKMSKRPAREMTAEQRQASSDRFRKVREAGMNKKKVARCLFLK